jgi:hypothetical protein
VLILTVVFGVGAAHAQDADPAGPIKAIYKTYSKDDNNPGLSGGCKICSISRKRIHPPAGPEKSIGTYSSTATRGGSANFGLPASLGQPKQTRMRAQFKNHKDRGGILFDLVNEEGAGASMRSNG